MRDSLPFLNNSDEDARQRGDNCEEARAESASSFLDSVFVWCVSVSGVTSKVFLSEQPEV